MLGLVSRRALWIHSGSITGAQPNQLTTINIDFINGRITGYM